MSLNFIIPFTPKPTPRPRVTRWTTYYEPTYKDYKDKLEEHANILATKYNITPTENEYRVRLDFFIPRPIKTVKKRPKGDLDNYAKGILDSLNKVIWKDDDQVIELKLLKHWTDAKEGWTNVSIE